MSAHANPTPPGSGAGHSPLHHNGTDDMTHPGPKNPSSGDAAGQARPGDTFDTPAGDRPPGRGSSAGAAHPPHPPASSATMENEAAIPTAGGQRLGQEHWGESKLIPDNPQP